MFVIRLPLPGDRAEQYTAIEPTLLLVPLVRHSTECLIEEIGELVAADILFLDVALELLKVLC